MRGELARHGYASHRVNGALKRLPEFLQFLHAILDTGPYDLTVEKVERSHLQLEGIAIARSPLHRVRNVINTAPVNDVQWQ